MILVLFAVFLVLLLVPKELIKTGLTGKVVSTVRIVSSFPPQFAHNMTNFTVNQSSNFYFDVNCTDDDVADVLTYLDNFTGFDINDSTGVINQTSFGESFVGNNTINLTCTDGIFTDSRSFNLEIQNSNDAPVLSEIGSQVATEGTVFDLDVDATDSEGDTLVFASNSTIFTINSATGMINFTPSLSDVGNHTINITVFDGFLYDYEVISFRVARGPYCGDVSCGNGENCATCPGDCGACPEPPPGEEGESGSSSGGAGSASGADSGTASSGAGRAPFYRCDEKWECSEWNKCSIESFTTRKCTDVNKCITKLKKPKDIDRCEYVPTCDDGIRNGGEEKIDCGGPCDPCEAPTCTDKIQNQDETGVDCGGPCDPCEVKKFAKIPFLELQQVLKIPKQFPWLLILLISLLIAMTVTGDRVYVHRIKKKKFEDYRKAYTKYRPLQKKLYKSSMNTAAITILVSLYIYMFSNNFENLISYSWIPAAGILLIPVAVSAVIRHYSYYEYKKKSKEEMMKQTHKREIIQIMDVENRLLVDIEKKLKSNVYSLATKHKFDNYPELYKELNPIYSTLSNAAKSRKERVDMINVDSEAFRKILDLLEDKTLLKAADTYEEFTSILKLLEYVQDKVNIDTYDKEEELMLEIEEISKPHMISVVKSSKRYGNLYNKLVDLYEYFTKRHIDIQSKEKELAGIEREFTDEIKGMTKKPVVLDDVQKEAEFVSIYNSLVDLFNHYLKRQELSMKKNF